MEKAVRWSPFSTPTDQRFLYVDVTGKSLRLCKVNSFNAHTKTLGHETIATHTKVPAFRAFDWSPIDESLIAVGQSSGEATILRMPAGQDSQEVFANFPVRHQRYCNAIALSGSGLIAAGLDRVRNDYCLNVWDLVQRLDMKGTKGFVEPLRKMASSEPITSVKWFSDQADTLVAGVKGQFVRVYDLREGAGLPSMQFPTRCVHNLAIDSLDENYIASGLTSPTDSTSTVCIWDRRMGARHSAAATPGLEHGQMDPALEFKNVIAPKSAIWSLRFSRTKRGCLGVLSDSGQVKTYNIVKEYVAEEFRSPIDRTLGRNSVSDYPEQIYTKSVRDVFSPYNHPLRGYEGSERVVSFDFLNMASSNEPSILTLSADDQVKVATVKPPAPPVRLSSQGTLVCGRPDENCDFKSVRPFGTEDANIGTVVKELRDGALARQDEKGALDALNAMTGLDDVNNANDVNVMNDLDEDLIAQDIVASSREDRERTLSVGTQGSPLTVEEALTLMTVNRLRCKEGYLFNGSRNKQILADDPPLQDFWDWIERARSDSATNSMVMHHLDLNYIGVFDIWTGDLGVSLQSRWLGPNATHYPDINDTIVDLIQALRLPEIKSCKTSFSEHRRLGLRVCGTAQSYEELEEFVKTLSANGQHTKAAALAVFQDEPKLAYLALRSHTPTQAHKLLAMAIAGAAKGDTDSDWEETCAEIAKELTDPYARAILALVSKGDWRSVIQEATLPLRYRVEVALRWLPDDDLTTYLTETTKEAIQQGDIEGIVLTGLSHSAMELFQSYINKYDDIQTPVLAMSHTVPRFVNTLGNKHRFETWRETYRWQINSWKLQLERARFDVGSRKFAATWDGRRLIEPPRQQVSLTCNYCTRPLTQIDPSSPSPSNGGVTTGEVVHPTAGNPLGSSAMSGMVCPRCGRHMPRCGVCTLWLGSPDPMTKACLASEAGTKTTAEQRRLSEAEIMRRFIVFCINCNHGFHAHHAREWFGKHRVCPVAECSCICDR
ncbi:WD40-repeat-containing domain protein [Aspergillus californicus]